LTDEPVAITNNPPRLTIDRLEAMEKVNGGHNMGQVIAADSDFNLRARSLVFLALWARDKDAGITPDPGDIWERAGVAEFYFAEASPVRPDPTSGESSKTSPFSAVTGE
jgi:hypothetical protein